MNAIPSVAYPEELVDIYWGGICDLIDIGDSVALSGRHVEPPD